MANTEKETYKQKERNQQNGKNGNKRGEYRSQLPRECGDFAPSFLRRGQFSACGGFVFEGKAERKKKKERARNSGRETNHQLVAGKITREILSSPDYRKITNVK